MKKADAMKKIKIKDYKSLITERIVNYDYVIKSQNHHSDNKSHHNTNLKICLKDL